jgi:hypothetical protein
MGYLTVELDDPSNPTHITLRDFQATAMGPYVLSYSWSLLGQTVAIAATIGTLDQPASVRDTSPGTGTPAPINPDGSFTLANVPLTSSGVAYYSGTASGSFDLSTQTTVPTLPGTIHITNDVATLHMEFSLATNLSISITNSGTVFTINADGSFNGIINAVGGTTVPRYMIWNNGAGTGNWNTNDLNWNNGSAKWENLRGAKDCAIFGATGIGTVNLSQPVTAGSLYFQSPGYTITGNSLALANAGAVTNDADSEQMGSRHADALRCEHLQRRDRCQRQRAPNQRRRRVGRRAGRAGYECHPQWRATAQQFVAVIGTQPDRVAGRWWWVCRIRRE